MKEGSTGEPCPECTEDNWQITATMIHCKACGACWGRCNGLWVGPVKETQSREAKPVYNLNRDSFAVSGKSRGQVSLYTAHVDRDRLADLLINRSGETSGTEDGDETVVEDAAEKADGE